MSTLSSWSFEAVMTIWPVTTDEYGQPTYGTPYTLPCDFSAGGDIQRDDTGTEFVPDQTFWFELPFGDPLEPEREWYVAAGDSTATSDPLQAGGQRIRKVGGWPMEKFGAGEIPDRVLHTG